MISLVTVLATAVIAAAPNTAITAGPVGESGLATPKFEFSAEGAAGYECSLDGAPYTSCGSPYRLEPLSEGAHTFAVRAVGADGTVDDTPALRRWSYVPSPLGNVIIKLRTPAKATTARRSFKTISGTTRSTASKVSYVQVAIQTGRADKDYFPPACKFFDMRTGALSLRPCVLPGFKTVKGTAKWSYKVPAALRARLKPGDYTIIIRAFNAFNQATRRDFKLTLR